MERGGQVKKGWAASDRSARRESLSSAYRILLPNSFYGSWESRLYDFRHALSNEEKLEIKLNKLETWQ